METDGNGVPHGLSADHRSMACADTVKSSEFRQPRLFFPRVSRLAPPFWAKGRLHPLQRSNPPVFCLSHLEAHDVRNTYYPRETSMVLSLSYASSAPRAADQRMEREARS